VTRHNPAEHDATLHRHGKHGSPEFQKLAEDNTILRVQVGSGVHGTSVAGTDDRDEMGVCIEPPEFVMGLRTFEQFEHHTAWEREGGLRNRSGPGDLDIVIYSLRKFMRLALNGNPSILTALFASPKDTMSCTTVGYDLLELTPSIVSKEAAPRFTGYLHAQRRSMLSREGKGRDVTRPELIEKYGWDTKFGGHMIRLGHQGIELMETGRITLPMPEAQRQEVIGFRTGKYSFEDCLDRAEELENKLIAAAEASDLSEHPDRKTIDAWLIEAHKYHWLYGAP
jgi:uncharacterized protein